LSSFTIPLLDRGNSRSFSSDFLVWIDKFVIAIDTKGDHLITEDAARKLFYMGTIEDGPELSSVSSLGVRGRWQQRASLAGGLAQRDTQSGG
jgi:type III restriction enzyme